MEFEICPGDGQGMSGVFFWDDMLEYTHDGSMYAIYGNIYHQYTPNVSIYTIHGSVVGYDMKAWLLLFEREFKHHMAYTAFHGNSSGGNDD